MDILKRIQDYALEDIMGDRFGAYAKEIIQDRAIPDVRDGLKPVQRRILYGMYKDHNTYDKPTRKSAKTVGYIMGNYHPHGDSSIYDAMVRMSQWWKQNTPYIDMQGNNGSMDGDSAAAMRYTEARLSKISNELLKDIDKETVSWAPNFDDTELEPTVLPAKFPNLLVNGANGISAGYATNIPPHNLGEIIDATIKRIDSPNCRLETILDIVKGPDFPTGAIVEGKKGIIDAFTTGRGKVVITSKCEFVREKSHEQIIVHEIPFEVNKAMLVNKIDSIRIDKKIDGIAEVRDESDRDGLRIAIDLKTGANKELILNYLLKNTDLQISYSYNMVAIVNRTPMTLGIIPILDAYIAHQKEIITRRSEFDLATYKKRLNIVEGFLKMISILDEVIKTIRASKNKSDAKDNLVKKFDFTVEQAEAIVTLQLYKLTNTDVVALEEEQEQLHKFIQALELILSDESKLKEVMKHELKKVKTEYATPRKSEIRDEITEIKIDSTNLIPKENAIVVITKEGYVKRVSLRSYEASKEEETGLKDGDYVIGRYNMSTMDTVLIFTDCGNYLHIPVYELPDLKWKDMGKHVSNVVQIKSEENVIASIPIYDFNESTYITTFTKCGMVKKTLLSDYKVQRYNKPLTAIKLKDDDKVVNVVKSNDENIFVTTQTGYGLMFKSNEIPLSGVKSGGVKSIILKNDIVVSGSVFDDNMEYLTILTDKNTAKRIRLNELELSARAKRGTQIIRDIKTNPYKIISVYVINYKESLGLKTKLEIINIKLTDIPIADKKSTGSTISKQDIIESFEITKLIKKENKKEIEKENISLESIDNKIISIDDLLEDIENNQK